MLGRMVGMNHVVLDSDIVSTKDQDGFAPRMIKTLQVVNDSVDANLGSFQSFESTEAFLCGIGINLVVLDPRLAQSELVSVGSHVQRTTNDKEVRLTFAEK